MSDVLNFILLLFYFCIFSSKRVCLNTLHKVQKILRNVTVSENTFQSFNIEVYEIFFFFRFSSGQVKLLILQNIWLYISISISKEI